MSTATKATAKNINVRPYSIDLRPTRDGYKLVAKCGTGRGKDAGTYDVNIILSWDGFAPVLLTQLANCVEQKLFPHVTARRRTARSNPRAVRPHGA